ncbi:mannose-1-phosphate guanylyltransferase / phosphomannomutase [Caloramator fervidus]|uniref:Mannose-1-phosphate guanylyltransferase / phosphomannomutase n=1 Tax=Caloramator fervidus TaxID=29344 RepID=A0A1H5W4V5_9CLOT|nr:sugar phosphate nucleotidyltransferase [Caloramator fervidus]SEF94522.1 mannose-1-phosphate guanylyltransferase / phosphomannomutase [Caloramator fervidus]
MKAVIMAGGEGTRLRPLTCGIPKPMVPILNKPVIEYTIKLLKKYNFDKIAITTCYLSNFIIDYLGDGSKFGISIDYYIEETPLGTGGSVLNTGDFIDQTILVISGDVLTDIDLSKAIEFHKNKNSKATLILKRATNPLEYGIVITNSEGKIERFLEKPSWGEVFSDTINTGIYILEKDVFNYYKKGDSFDFSKDLFPRLLKDNVPMYGYITDEYWNDIGDINSYKQTHFDILNGKVKVDLDLPMVKEGIYIGEGTVIKDDVIINPPVYIGKNCIINSKAKLDSFTIIGDNCKIEENASIKKSIIWNNTSIGQSTQARSTIICNKVIIKNNVNLFEDSVVGTESTIESFCTINPSIKIWPFKKIKESSIVNNNLVWGTKVSKTLFGNRNISGDINIDITPEYASVLGSAYANIVNKSKPVVVSCDDSNTSKAIKNSILSGLLSSGIRIIDIEDVTLPIARNAVMFYNASGGIHTYSDINSKNKVYIEFINEKGGNIDRSTEKKLEHLYHRQDFERCNSDSIKDVIKIYNYSSYYINTILSLLKNIPKIKNNSPKILLSSESELSLSIVHKILTEIGCKVFIDYSLRKGLDKESLDILSKKVANEGFFLGILINFNGESLKLIDNKGNIIDNEKYILLTELILAKTGKCKKFIVPYTATKQIEEIAKNYSLEVIRTKSNISNLLNEILKDNDLIYQYLLNFDASAASALIIDFVIDNNITLYELVNEIPRFYTKHREIVCDISERGKIIRQLIEQNKDKNIELFEGLKINTEKGWVIIIPDNEKPTFNIYSEGYSEEFAEEISFDIYNKILNLINNS